MRPKPVLVVGASGQLGQSLTAAWPEAEGIGRHGLDLSRPESVAAFDLSPYGVVVNAAAYTKVDAAESAQGRREAWAVNVAGVGALVRAAREHRCTLVHISSDYVFDGRNETHDEQEPFSPLGVYGQTKAAGDALVATWDRALPAADQLGDRGRAQLRPHHGRAGGARGVAVGGRRPARAAHLHRRAGPGDPAPARRRRAVRHLQREQRRTDPDLGRHRGRGVRRSRPGPGRRDPGEHGGVRARARTWPPGRSTARCAWTRSPPRAFGPRTAAPAAGALSGVG